MGKKTEIDFLLWICLTAAIVHSSEAAYWTAYLKHFTRDNDTEYNNETSRFYESGIYGRNSPLEGASGQVELPMKDLRGCGPYPVFNVTQQPWVALIKRGKCTFSEKINAAKRQGASGVVIYNVDGSGDLANSMDHEDAKDIVAISMGNNKAMTVVNLIQRGEAVEMIIKKGKHYGQWIEGPQLYLMGSVFAVVTVGAVGYFLLTDSFSFMRQHLQTVRERQLKTKAISNLKVRKLKKGDKETASEDACAICIDLYKPGDQVTTLTCSHLFHGHCIEPWLLDHRTCPMCKQDVLERPRGKQEEDFHSPGAPPDGRSAVTARHDVRELPSSDPPVVRQDLSDLERGLEPMNNPEGETPLGSYDNQAFQGDAQVQGNTAEDQSDDNHTPNVSPLFH